MLALAMFGQRQAHIFSIFEILEVYYFTGSGALGLVINSYLIVYLIELICQFILNICARFIPLFALILSFTLIANVFFNMV